MTTNRWEYGSHYRNLDMTGEIALPNASTVMVCDWTITLPSFMLAADTLFIDPPWSIGNARSFYTKSGMSEHPKSFESFTSSLFDRVDQISPRTLFVEMGKEHLDVYIAGCKARYKYVTFYNSTYYKKDSNKCYVVHASNEFSERRYPNLEDLDESEIIRWICANHGYRCIGDLCMGRGLVGLGAYRAARQFVGTELNHKRLAVLVSAIHKEELRRATGKFCA